MRRRSLVSIVVLCGSFWSVGGSLSAQTAGGSTQAQGATLLEEIRSMVSDMSSRASAAEAAQPPQASVASCLNQSIQNLNQYEASGSAAFSALEAAVNGGDSGTADSQLSLLKLANRNAKTAVAAASACDAGSGVAGSVDANGDGVPDSETSTGGISGLDDLEGEDETEAGFSIDEYLPSGDSVNDEATSDVFTSPAVTQ
jgi:hypothetical protein